MQTHLNQHLITERFYKCVYYVYIITINKKLPKMLGVAFSIFFISAIAYIVINEHYRYLKSFKAGNNEFK